MLNDIKFGRLIPKDRSYEQNYAFRKLGVGLPITVEKVFLHPPLRTFYDQGETSACTGFSSTWQMSIYNQYRSILAGKDRQLSYIKYNAPWLYQQACLNDGDPRNDPPLDVGGYVWSTFWVLNHLGHTRVGKVTPDLKDGISSYYWCSSVDEMRTAFSLNRMVVIGVNWYSGFMSPEYKNGEYWVGTKTNLGQILGGHAILCKGVSDKRQAFRLINSWGLGYPLVWLPYSTMERLLREDGEAVVAVDKLTVT